MTQYITWTLGNYWHNIHSETIGFPGAYFSYILGGGH